MFKIGDWVKWLIDDPHYIKIGQVKSIRTGKDGTIMLYLLNWTRWIPANECELI